MGGILFMGIITLGSHKFTFYKYKDKFDFSAHETSIVFFYIFFLSKILI